MQLPVPPHPQVWGVKAQVPKGFPGRLQTCSRWSSSSSCWTSSSTGTPRTPRTARTPPPPSTSSPPPPAAPPTATGTPRSARGRSTPPMTVVSPRPSCWILPTRGSQLNQEHDPTIENMHGIHRSMDDTTYLELAGR